ncbi:MAG TPA: ribosome silencing factor [Rheinheimera sp.]|nr:ribosome silencing factor [Rheinheimera sp.]
MQSIELLQLVLEKIDDMKARDITAIDMHGKTGETDFMVVCTGTSNRHTKSIAWYLISELKNRGLIILGVEGDRHGDWVLIDLGDVVVHVMLEESRSHYQLEKLWAA